jgi:alkaline phosphatase
MADAMHFLAKVPGWPESPPNQRMLSRRSFLTRSGIAAATATITGAPHIVRSAEELATRTGQKPKRIIHIVSDGMSLGTLTCANLFAQSQFKRELTWLKLFNNPAARHGLMNTRSLNSLVTDSAAASSSWGSGSRVCNGSLNALPTGQLLTPLYTLFAQQGWARGLVTTAEVTHATPAGFAAATRSRDNARQIAAQYFDRRIEVLLGGGKSFFKPAAPRRRRREKPLKPEEKRDLRSEFGAAGYSVVRDRASLASAPTDTPLLGLFSDSHMPYTVDQLASKTSMETVPNLAEMTRAALTRLERKDQFILQVEGARIDHAAHNSDAAAAFRDQIALDDAIDVCLEFQLRHPDTLVVITTDHGNSNAGLNGMGAGYRHSPTRFAALAEIKASYPEILKKIEKLGEKVKVPSVKGDEEDKLDIPDPMKRVVPPGDTAPEEGKETKVNSGDNKTDKTDKTDIYRVEAKVIADVIGETTGYKMSARRAALFSKVLAGEYQALYDQMNSSITQLGQLMANRVGIGWVGNSHTSDYVPVVAIGPGSERFAGFIQNTDIFVHYTELAGIDFRNPSMPLIAESEHFDVERAHRYAYV